MGGRAINGGTRSNDLVSSWCCPNHANLRISVLRTKLVATACCTEDGAAAESVTRPVTPTTFLAEGRCPDALAASVRPNRIARPKSEKFPGPKTAKNRPRDASAQGAASVRTPVARPRSDEGVPAYVAADEA